MKSNGDFVPVFVHVGLNAFSRHCHAIALATANQLKIFHKNKKPKIGKKCIE
jgi:hypothetical protein